MLNDLAQRFKAFTYNKDHTLKHMKDDLRFVYFLCSGSVGVFETKLLDNSENDNTVDYNDS